MKIIVQWHNVEQTVILVKMTKGWAWQDMYQSILTVEDMLDSVSHTVCTIYDFIDGNQVPSHALIHIKNLSRQARPNQAKIALIGLNMVGKSLLNIYEKLYGTFSKGRDVQPLPTIEAAYDFFDIEMKIPDDS